MSFDSISKLDEHFVREARLTADLMLGFVKKHVTSRKGAVFTMAFGLRAALDELSPDERSRFREWIVGEML